MRIGEILALTWDNVNVDRECLSIEKSKTEAGIRTVPLNATVLAVFRKRAIDQAVGWTGPDRAEHRVFTGMTTERFHALWPALMRRAGTPGARFHDMRHTAITLMCEAGVPDWSIRSIVGHVDSRILAVYSHTRLEALRSAMTTLEFVPPDPAPEVYQVPAAPPEREALHVLELRVLRAEESLRRSKMRRDLHAPAAKVAKLPKARNDTLFPPLAPGLESYPD